MSWRGLRYKGTERLTSREWNAVVDALNDLYGFLTGGLQDIYVREVYGHSGYFNTRVYCEGRPVILDGDPISIYQFYDIAKSQITEAIDKSSQLAKIVSGLDQIYGKLPSAQDITSAINNAKVTSSTDLIAQYTGASKDVLDKIYGKLPSKEDITSAVDSALVTGYSLDIREYTRRTAETIEAYAPKLATIEEYTRETRDVLVKIKIDEYGNVGVKIAEPLDEYGYVPVSTVYDRAGLAKDATLQLLTKALRSIGGDNVLIFIADSGIIVPVDIQARYKPPGMTLYSGTVTSSGNTADIDVSMVSALEIELKVTSVSGTTPTLDVYIEGKFEATRDYKVLASQTEITSTGIWFFTINPLIFRYIRVRWVVGGVSPSFTFTVTAQAMV